MEQNLFFSNFNKFPEVSVAMSLRPDKNMKAYYDYGKDEKRTTNFQWRSALGTFS